MKRSIDMKTWLPLARSGGSGKDLPTGEAFRSDWIDFSHGIRVGNLEPHERITQILKFHLQESFGTPFITDRWGRGVYWQWICWLPKANRQAKPVSHSVKFDCAKLFITVDREQGIFKSGLQVERGYTAGPEAVEGWSLGPDWDWHRLVKQLRQGSVLDRELHRLLHREGFTAEVGNWDEGTVFTDGNFKSVEQVRTAVRKAGPETWAGFQLYYPMPAKEVRSCAGYEIVKAVCAVFAEVIPAMNACMQVKLARGMGTT